MKQLQSDLNSLETDITCFENSLENLEENGWMRGAGFYFLMPFDGSFVNPKQLSAE